MPRKSLRNKSTYNISFTGFHDDEREQLLLYIKDLPAKYCETISDATTHIICKKLVRTEKFLVACLKGCWLLKESFLEQSHAEKKLVDEMSHQLCLNETLVGTDRRQHILNSSPFSGWVVLLDVDNGLYKMSLKRILQQGGATIIRSVLATTIFTHIFYDPKNAKKSIYLDIDCQRLDSRFIADTILYYLDRGMQGAPPDTLDYLCKDHPVPRSRDKASGDVAKQNTFSIFQRAKSLSQSSCGSTPRRKNSRKKNFDSSNNRKIDLMMLGIRNRSTYENNEDGWFDTELIIGDGNLYTDILNVQLDGCPYAGTMMAKPMMVWAQFDGDTTARFMQMLRKEKNIIDQLACYSILLDSVYNYKDDKHDEFFKSIFGGDVVSILKDCLDEGNELAVNFIIKILETNAEHCRKQNIEYNMLKKALWPEPIHCYFNKNVEDLLEKWARRILTADSTHMTEINKLLPMIGDCLCDNFWEYRHDDTDTILNVGICLYAKCIVKSYTSANGGQFDGIFKMIQTINSHWIQTSCYCTIFSMNFDLLLDLKSSWLGVFKKIIKKPCPMKKHALLVQLMFVLVPLLHEVIEADKILFVEQLSKFAKTPQLERKIKCLPFLISLKR